MEKSATHYLIEAIIILKANITYVLIPIILISSSFLLNYVDSSFRLLFLSTILITTLILLPAYYGQLIEIVKRGQKDEWRNVFNKYWVKIFIVKLILFIPLLLFSFFNINMPVLTKTVSFMVGAVSMYVLPMVLLKGEIWDSIVLGLKCFLGNFVFSLPMVLASSIVFLFPILTAFIYNNTDAQIVSYGLIALNSFVGVFTEFTVFIAAGLIIKEKLLAAGQVEME